MMNHYVYLLIDETNDMKYIGKRSCKCKPEDDVNYMSSSKYVPKEQCDKIVLAEFNTAKEAVAYEIELHNRFDVAVNDEFYNRAKQTSTGWDTTGINSWNKGIPCTEETKQKLSEALKGRVISEESKIKISKALKGHKSSELQKKQIAKTNSKRVWSKESIDKMKQSKKGQGSKKILCVETGVVFNSVKEALAFIGRKVGSSISNVCNGKRKTTGGYHWKYYNESEVA